MNKYFCDMCKKEITDWEGPMGPDFRRWEQGEDDITLEICLECHERLRDFIRQNGAEWV